MTKTKSDVSIVRAAVAADSVGRLKNGNVILRDGFFYRHGKTAQDFADRVKRQLDKAGIKHEIVDQYEHWTAFSGGASLANSSHWGVEVKLIRDDKAAATQTEADARTQTAKRLAAEMFAAFSKPKQ